MIPRSVLLAVGLTFLICSNLPALQLVVPEPAHELIDMAWLDKTMSESDALIVHEGLPHQLFEQADREAETKRVPILKIDDQLVYARPLDVTELDRRKLSEALGSNRAWVPPKRGLFAMKLCGGFHADYAVTWSKKDQPLATLLICFGCHELRFIHEGASITTDMTKDGYEELRTILKDYRQERPPFRQSEDLEPLKSSLPKAEPPKIDYKP